MMFDISFDLSENDLVMVSDDANMIGACIRRLDCFKNSPLIYSDYGSELETLIGLKKSDVNLSLIEQEVVNTLYQDSRVNSVEAEAKYTMNGICVNVTLNYMDNEELDFEYIIGE